MTNLLGAKIDLNLEKITAEIVTIESTVISVTLIRNFSFTLDYSAPQISR